MRSFPECISLVYIQPKVILLYMNISLVHQVAKFSLDILVFSKIWKNDFVIFTVSKYNFYFCGILTLWGIYWRVCGIQNSLGKLVHSLCHKTFWKSIDSHPETTLVKRTLPGLTSMYMGCHNIILLLIPRAEISACSLGGFNFTSTLCCSLTFFSFKIKFLYEYLPYSDDEVIILVFPKCFIFVTLNNVYAYSSVSDWHFTHSPFTLILEV